jgi:hypothetical protein
MTPTQTFQATLPSQAVQRDRAVNQHDLGPFQADSGTNVGNQARNIFSSKRFGDHRSGHLSMRELGGPKQSEGKATSSALANSCMARLLAATKRAIRNGDPSTSLNICH